MLDNRVLIVDFLNGHRGGSFAGRRKMWTINDVLAVDGSGLASGDAFDGTNGCFADRGSWNWAASNGGNPVDGDTTVDDRGFVDGVIVDDRRIIVNASDLGRGQTASAEVAFAEIMDANKSEVIGAQTEIEVDADVQAIETPAGSNFKYSARRL